MEREESSKKPAIIVRTHSKQEAETFRDCISRDEEKKQIRGVHSRGAKADIEATLKKYNGWMDSNVVFGLEEHEVVKIGYTLAEDKT